ncbi:hypothetical protein RJ639_031013, partial [Escallonia herrerae]
KGTNWGREKGGGGRQRLEERSSNSIGPCFEPQFQPSPLLRHSISAHQVPRTSSFLPSEIPGGCLWWLWWSDVAWWTETADLAAISHKAETAMG